jgi:hypothetical protein
MDASRALGIATGKISACAQGKASFANGYTWKYKDDTLASTYSTFVPKLCGAKSSGEVYRVLQDGTRDIYRSGKYAQKQLNMRTDIVSAIKKGQKAGGYVWRYVDEEQQSKYPEWKPPLIEYKSKGRVYRIMEDGSRDEYASAGEAERKLKINHVRRAVDKGQKAGGYRWYTLL